MEAAEHTHHQDQSASELNGLAVAATAHCLIGCATGEVVGMALAEIFGWSNLAQTLLAIALAYLFGFALTSVPLVKAGLPPRKIVSTALASDTVSITIMEVIDNATVILIPSALNAGLEDALFWGSIAIGFAIAFPFAFLANRYLIARGRGHAVVHEYHQH
jgi:putative flippase GtrA